MKKTGHEKSRDTVPLTQRIDRMDYLKNPPKGIHHGTDFQIRDQEKLYSEPEQYVHSKQLGPGEGVQTV